MYVGGGAGVLTLMSAVGPIIRQCSMGVFLDLGIWENEIGENQPSRAAQRTFQSKSFFDVELWAKELSLYVHNVKKPS